ncbi:MAG: long-chain fatty acid--CoA ligase [Roseateles depolymerans]|uniref:Long-chain fatty acid--CoA ligase n=1 Tax=Roseateles depolymerans TaxID=76731 RepID=A0A2W5DMH0_9BURK|nr:MAG: long-chain fatty acid--CoA ligase [Roseateles depolymerans]
MLPIDHFWQAAERWPERIAVDSPQAQLSYAALARQVAALAAALMAIDPAPQSRVGICAANHAGHIVALLATMACGKVWVPLNPKTSAAEIRRIVDATEPSLLILDEAYAPLLDGAPATLLRIEELPALMQPHAGATPPRLELPPDATQAIKFTGGSTGLPKGVMQPLRAWNACIAAQIAAWQLGPEDRYVLAAPITHGTGTYLLPVLATGGCHVVLDGSGAEAVREAFRTRGGSLAFMPPTLVYMLMALPGASHADFPRLRALIYGGAPMPPEKIREALAFFGPVLGTTYGQTEAPQVLSVMRTQDFADATRWASVGRATAGAGSELAIMAPDGRLLPAGEIGEVVARGELLMTGYWRLPAKTAETLVDGWLHTGDRGYLDADGWLYLKDRLRDVVITGGFNVYPVDVENALGQHPAVHECAVFGVPDDKWGEAVHAAVQLRPGLAAGEAELIAFVRERLGPVATPKRIHLHASLPRSPVGKVLKTAVRELALQNPERP